jgi:hypothetical protein
MSILRMAATHSGRSFKSVVLPCAVASAVAGLAYVNVFGKATNAQNQPVFAFTKGSVSVCTLILQMAAKLNSSW